MKNDFEKDKLLLTIEWILIILGALCLWLIMMIPVWKGMPEEKIGLYVLIGFIPFLVSMGFAIKIEQIAGYYECRKCNHKYVPTYSSVLWATHFGRTRYMRCPKCNEKSWQRKVLEK